MAEVILRYSNFSVPALKELAERAGSSTHIGLSTQATTEKPLRLAVDDSDPPCNWRVTEAQRAAALEVFVNGGSIGAAALAAGLAWSTTRVLLSPQVVISGRNLVTRHQITEDELSEAHRLREQGWSYTALAERYGMSRTALTRRLKARRPNS